MKILVDPVDDMLLTGFSWQISKGYAWRSVTHGGKQHAVYLHREIIDPPPGMDVDHINRDTLDNRRANLRIATRTENSRNRAKNHNNPTFKGVHGRPDNVRNPWRAGIGLPGGRTLWLGYHPTPEAAARAYDKAAREHFGEFARLNFPEDI